MATLITDRNVARGIVDHANNTIRRQEWCEEAVRLATKEAREALLVPDFDKAAEAIERAKKLEAGIRAERIAYEALRATVDAALFDELMAGERSLDMAAAA